MSIARVSRDEVAKFTWVKPILSSVRLRTIYTEADHNSELFHDREKKEYPVAKVSGFLILSLSLFCFFLCVKN